MITYLIRKLLFCSLLIIKVRFFILLQKHLKTFISIFYIMCLSVSTPILRSYKTLAIDYFEKICLFIIYCKISKISKLNFNLFVCLSVCTSICLQSWIQWVGGGAHPWEKFAPLWESYTPSAKFCTPMKKSKYDQFKAILPQNSPFFLLNHII